MKVAISILRGMAARQKSNSQQPASSHFDHESRRQLMLMLLT